MTWYVVSIVVLVIALWFTIMVALWSINNNNKESHLKEHALVFFTKNVRFVRRGWYTTLRWIAIGLKILLSFLAKIFFAVFPKAKKAFEKKDELTGLEKGPSSYFLMSVSEYKEEIKKFPTRRGRNKKNV